MTSKYIKNINMYNLFIKANFNLDNLVIILKPTLSLIYTSLQLKNILSLQTPIDQILTNDRKIHPSHIGDFR